MSDHRPGRPAAPFTERTPRVVSASKLLRAANRRKEGRFLAEGANSVEAAVRTGNAREVFCGSGRLDHFAGLLGEAEAAGIPVSPVEERALRRLSDAVTPPGLVAVCDSVVRDVAAPGALTEAVAGMRLVAVGAGLAEPGNSGTLTRVADALGADAVVATAGSVDPENPKAVRASAGSLFHLPVLRSADIGATLAELAAAGLRVLVADAAGEVDLDAADELLAAPTAWVFGNEAHGFTSEVLAAADHRVRIPIRGRAESLNIVTAASICLHASARLH